MSTDKQTGDPRPSPRYVRLREALEANGIDVVSLDKMAGDPYLRYGYEPEERRRALVVIALVFAKHPNAISDVAQVAAVDPDTGDRRGYFYVDLDLITQLRHGDLEKMAYGAEVAKTWTAYGEEDGDE